MSFAKMGKVFPQAGIVFPANDLSRQYALVIAGALRDQLGDTHRTIKTVIKWTDANERTVKNWLAGTSGPSGEHLIALARNSDEVFDALLLLMGRDPQQEIGASTLIRLRERLQQALTLADAILAAGSCTGK